MKRLYLLGLLAAGLIALTGCVSSKTNTSTGLPYWPPGSTGHDDAPPAVRPGGLN